MIDKRSESNISTNETKKAAVRSHIGSRTAACLLILYSFLSLGVRTTPDHKSGRAHLQNVASRWAKLKFWKIKFLQLFHSKSGELYVKTPHFRAAFSALHLSSTHFGAGGVTRTHDLLITKCIGALHLTVFRDFGAFPLGILREVRPILSIVFVRSFPRVGLGVGQTTFRIRTRGVPLTTANRASAPYPAHR